MRAGVARWPGHPLTLTAGRLPQHILIVATWYPSDRDPIIGSFVEQQARILSRRYRVTVVAPAVQTLPVLLRHGFYRVRPWTKRSGGSSC